MKMLFRFSLYNQKYYLQIPRDFSFSPVEESTQKRKIPTVSFCFQGLDELLCWRVINHYREMEQGWLALQTEAKLSAGCPDEWAVSGGAAVVSVLFSCLELCLPFDCIPSFSRWFSGHAGDCSQLFQSLQLVIAWQKRYLKGNSIVCYPCHSTFWISFCPQFKLLLD